MIFKKQKNVIIERFDDQLIVFDLTRNLPYILNHAASFIMTNTDGKMDTKGMAKKVCGKFEVEYNQALDDVKNLYNDFIQKKLVKAVE